LGFYLAPFIGPVDKQIRPISWQRVGSRFPRRIAYSTQSRGQGCCNSKRACDRMEASCGFFFFGH
jgi:hypothetical protein